LTWENDFYSAGIDFAIGGGQETVATLFQYLDSSETLPTPPAPQTITTYPFYPLWVDGETPAAQTSDTQSPQNFLKLDELKWWATLLHETLEAYMERLLERRQRKLHSSVEIAIVRDHIHYAHQAAFIVLTNPTGAGSIIDGLTIQQCIDWTKGMLPGPANITNAADLTQEGRDRTADEIFDNLRPNGVLIEAPTAAVLWNDPRTGQRLYIEDIKAMSHGTDSFTPRGYTQATTGLNLNDVTIPATFNNRAGWIPNINRI